MKGNLEDILVGLQTYPDALPREEFVKNARIRVLNLAAKTASTTARAPLGRFWLPLRFAAIGAVAALTLGAGIVSAAQASLPGSTLYPIKVASETVALGLAPTSQMRTAVAGTVIDRRAEEVTQLKTYATSDEVKRAFRQYQTTVRGIRTMRGLNQSKIEERIREHENLFDSEQEESTQTGQRRRDPVSSAPDQKREDFMPIGTPGEVPTDLPQRENKEGGFRINVSGVLGVHEADTEKSGADGD